MATLKKRTSRKANLTDVGNAIISILHYKTEFVVDEKGGIFDLPGGDGHMEFEPFSCNKRITITALLVLPTRNKEYFPPITRCERLCSRVFHFTCKGTSSLPVKITVPFKGSLHSPYVMHQRTTTSTWTRLEVKKVLPGAIVYELDYPCGLAVVLSAVPHEEFTISKDGGLYYFQNAKYCTLQVPKGSVSEDLTSVLRILTVQDNVLNTLREDFDCIKDISFLSPFYDFGCHKNFKRILTLKIPLPEWSSRIGRINEKALIFCTTGDRWYIHECTIKFTKTTACFRTYNLGIFCIAIPRYQKAVRPDASMNALYHGGLCIRVELLGFISKRSRLWQIWIGCVRPNEVESVIQEYLDSGFELLRISKDASIDHSQSKKDQGSDSYTANIKRMQQDLGFGDEENISKYIYCYEGMEIRIRISGDIEAKSLSGKKLTSVNWEKPPDIASESVYSNRRSTNVSLDIYDENLEEKTLPFFFFTECDDCYQYFEIKPTNEVREIAEGYFDNLWRESLVLGELEHGELATRSPLRSDSTITVSDICFTPTKGFSPSSSLIFHNQSNVPIGVERSSRGDKKSRKRRAELNVSMKILDSLPVDHRFEGKISCSVHSVTGASYLLNTFYFSYGLKDVLVFFGVGMPEKTMDRKKDIFKRSRSKIIPKTYKEVDKDLKVLNDASLKEISHHVTTGLRLGVFLNLPEDVISEIGCQSISEQTSPQEITHQVLLIWRNIILGSDKSREEVCNQLINAFTQIGRKDIACVLQMHCASNSEVTKFAFE